MGCNYFRVWFWSSVFLCLCVCVFLMLKKCALPVVRLDEFIRFPFARLFVLSLNRAGTTFVYNCSGHEISLVISSLW